MTFTAYRTKLYPISWPRLSPLPSSPNYPQQSIFFSHIKFLFSDDFFCKAMSYMSSESSNDYSVIYSKMFKIQWRSNQTQRQVRYKHLLGEGNNGKKVSQVSLRQENRKHSPRGDRKESLAIPHHFFVSPQFNYSIISEHAQKSITEQYLAYYVQ